MPMKNKFDQYLIESSHENIMPVRKASLSLIKIQSLPKTILLFLEQLCVKSTIIHTANTMRI